MTRLLCVIALAAACGSRPSATAHPAPTPSPDAGSAAIAPEAVDSDTCAALIAHAVALGVAERPPEQTLTADERRAIEAQLRGDLGARCVQLTRREVDCALAAQSLAAMQACAG